MITSFAGASFRSKKSAALAALALIAAVAVLSAGTGSAGAASAACPSSNPPNELVVAAGSSQTAQIGTQFQTNLQVALANSNGCPLTGRLAGVSVNFDAPGSGAGGVFASTGSREATVGTDANGVATAPTFTANDTAGSYTVDAHSDYGTVELYLSNTASGVVSTIAVAGASSQQATVGSAYPQPLQAQVLDANGNPVQGITVNFLLQAGAYGASATFLTGASQASATTNSAGQATSPLFVANGSPGRFTATASTSSISSVATYSLDNHAASNTLSATSTAGQTATIEGRYAKPLSARLLDPAGQPIEGATVTFTLNPGASGAGASFLGGNAQATSLTDASGQATSPHFTANATSGSFTATASITGGTTLRYALRNLAGQPDAIAAGAADGQSTRAGARFPIRLAVTVTDKNGNPVPGALVTFSAPAHGASGHFAEPHTRGKTSVALRTTRTVQVRTDGKGVAIAPTFTANSTPGGYAVTARAGGRRTAFALINSR